MDLTPQFFLSVLQIIWIDLLLSGDNAVVIALACRSLPARQKRVGVFLGASVALALRILFAVVVAELMDLPYLKVVGGALLLWIAVHLIAGGHDDHRDVKASDTLWRAVLTIAMADAVMSLDNVVAITAAARGNAVLFIFGLLFSLPLIVFGATLVMGVVARFPVLVWAGGGLLGWVAGEMVATDPAMASQFGPDSMDDLTLPFAAAGAALAVAAGVLLRWRAAGLRESGAGHRTG